MKISTKLLSTWMQTHSLSIRLGKTNFPTPHFSRSFASISRAQLLPSSSSSSSRARVLSGSYPSRQNSPLPNFVCSKRGFVYTSRYPAVDIPNEDLFSFIASNNDVAFDKSKVVTVDAITGKTCSHQELHDSASRLGSALIKSGLQPGEVVGICAPNCVEYVMAMLAVPGIGAILSPINQALKAHEMTFQMTTTKAKFVITTQEFLPLVEEAAEEIVGGGGVEKFFLIGGDSSSSSSSFASLLLDDGSAFPSAAERRRIISDPSSHVAYIPFSSGTTGTPKGVQLTHRNVVANVTQASHPDLGGRFEDGSRDRGLALLPMWHCYLLIHSIATMRYGTMFCIIPKFDPILFLKTISEHKLSSLALVPPLVVFMLENKELVDKYDLSCIKSVMVGAAPLGPDTHAAICERLGISEVRQAWGMSELSPAATICPRSEPIVGSCGVLIPNTEMKIVDKDRSTLGQGQEGEVAIRGPQVMKGYLNNPRATDEMIDSEGWLYTGDVGRVDPNDGHLRIVDRLKELIKYKGHQVAPAELEDVLLSHPSIADAAVIGIPDAHAGEVPRAFVKLHSAAVDDVDEKDVVDFVNGRVGAISWLRGGAEFVDAIPKAATGKILRRELRQKYQQTSAVGRQG